MQFCPSFNQTTLACWHCTFHEFNRIDTEYSSYILIISMEMWRVMSRADLPIHSNNYAVKTAQFGHAAFYDKLTFRII